jgi:hypothetical protein
LLGDKPAVEVQDEVSSGILTQCVDDSVNIGWRSVGAPSDAARPAMDDVELVHHSLLEERAELGRVIGFWALFP